MHTARTNSSRCAPEQLNQMVLCALRTILGGEGKAQLTVKSHKTSRCTCESYRLTSLGVEPHDPVFSCQPEFRRRVLQGAEIRQLAARILKQCQMTVVMMMSLQKCQRTEAMMTSLQKCQRTEVITSLQKCQMTVVMTRLMRCIHL
eukprot:1151062-Pelagomonas_calceolata.AAC.3